jgi:dsDNA-specific endonuclease/ATPase MutS2
MNEETTRHMPSDDTKLILARLEALEEKVDRRLQETRPIWESVQAELKELKNDYKDFRRLFNSTFASLARGQEDIVERLDKLEAGEVPK